MPPVIDGRHPDGTTPDASMLTIDETREFTKPGPPSPRQIKSIVRRDKHHGGSVVDSLKSLLFKPKRRHSVQFTVTQTYMLPPQLSTPNSDLYYTKSELRDIQFAARDGDDSTRVEIPEGTVRVQSFLTVLVAHPAWKASASSRTYYVVLKDHSLYLYRSAKIAQINQPEYQLDVASAVDLCEAQSINQELSLHDIAHTFAVLDAQDQYVVFVTDSAKSKNVWLTGLQNDHVALPQRHPSPTKLSKQRSS